MGFVKLYKSDKIDTPNKPRTPIANGEVFSTLITGKTTIGMGWFGDKNNIDQAHVGFSDGSYILVGWSGDFECPAITYVPPPKK